MNELHEAPPHLHPLMRLFPHYSRAELDEAYENLRRYVERGWQIALRLEREGRLESVLTEAGFNPTVTEPTHHSPTSLP